MPQSPVTTEQKAQFKNRNRGLLRNSLPPTATVDIDCASTWPTPYSKTIPVTMNGPLYGELKEWKIVWGSHAPHPPVEGEGVKISLVGGPEVCTNRTMGLEGCDVPPESLIATIAMEEGPVLHYYSLAETAPSWAVYSYDGWEFATS
jgi:hypothetical protein